MKTHLVDPVHDNANFRTEFRLHPNTAYLSNFRIANLGCHADVKSKCNASTGVHGALQSIHLHDGNQLLDQMLQFPTWSAFSNCNKSNQTTMDAAKNLAKNNLGFTFAGEDQATSDGTSLLLNAVITPRFSPDECNTTSSTTAKGWLSLKSILPLLDRSIYMPTGVFKDSRLVLQHESNPSVVVEGATSASAEEPMLIVDEIVDPSKQKQINDECKGLRFVGLEHDRLFLNGLAAADAVSSVTQTSSGFDDKTINRMLIVNAPVNASGNSTTFSTNHRDKGSVALLNQKIQIRINGQNRCPRDGITRPNERLAKLTDVWGTCNSVPGSNQTSLAFSEMGAGDVPLVAQVKPAGAVDLTLLQSKDAVGQRSMKTTSDGNDATIEFEITGKDVDGAALTEKVTGINSASKNSVNRCAEVSKISCSGATAGNITVDVTGSSPVVANPDLLGNLDCFGCSVGEVIQELQIDFERQGVAKGNDTCCNQALMLNVFAEALKEIKVHGGGKCDVRHVQCTLKVMKF